LKNKINLMKSKTFFANLKVVLNYLKSNIIKNPRTFKIGFVSIFLVVFFISLLMNAISISPVIFTRLTEDIVGEADIVMIPFDKKDVSKNTKNIDKIVYMDNNEIETNMFGLNADNTIPTFLNFTDILLKLKSEDYLQGVVPRWIFPNANSTYRNETYASANLLIIDSDLENKFKMGRKLELPKLKSYVINLHLYLGMLHK